MRDKPLALARRVTVGVLSECNLPSNVNILCHIQECYEGNNT